MFVPELQHKAWCGLNSTVLCSSLRLQCHSIHLSVADIQTAPQRRTVRKQAWEGTNIPQTLPDKQGDAVQQAR